MMTTLPPPTPTSRADEPSRHRRGLGYQPALDGLRAISVLAVLLYHADVAWIPGGFLGVEVFFVISGFLITTLLIEEWQRSHAIDRPHFWIGGPVASCPRCSGCWPRWRSTPRWSYPTSWPASGATSSQRSPTPPTGS